MITNKYGLPESLVRVVSSDAHRQHPDAVSVTQLINPIASASSRPGMRRKSSRMSPTGCS